MIIMLPYKGTPQEKALSYCLLLVTEMHYAVALKSITARSMEHFARMRPKSGFTS